MRFYVYLTKKNRLSVFFYKVSLHCFLSRTEIDIELYATSVAEEIHT